MPAIGTPRRAQRVVPADALHWTRAPPAAWRRHAEERSSSSSQSAGTRLISMVREALVTSVRGAAAGQLPDQPGIHGAEGQLAGAALCARAGHVVRIQRILLAEK